MGRPKALKPILIGCACLVPVGLVVGLSVNWSHTTFISAMGSSGARGIVNRFGQLYHDQYEDIEINAESGGTATGLTNVSLELCDIGNSTNNPKPFVDNLKLTWGAMKTYTLGWEAIALVYKMPEGLSDNAKSAFDISINSENIDDLLAVFSGYNGDNWTEGDDSYYHFLTPAAKAQIDLNPDDIQACQAPILPYARSGGNRSASASIAFSNSKNIHLETHLSVDQQKAFEGGQYGKDRKVYETDESNAQAWSMFEYNDLPGQMVYMTSSFFNENNMNIIKQKGYKLALYNGVSLLDSKGNFSLDKVCIKDGGYNWFRPINCSLSVKNENARYFMSWVFYVLVQQFRSQYIEEVRKLGIKELDDFQIGSMYPFDKTQTDERLDEWVYHDGIYGAREWEA